MSHAHTPTCYCFYERDDCDDEMDLPDYDEDTPAGHIEGWLDLLENNEVNVLRPLGEYIRRAGADTIAKSPELRMRVLTETRIYLIRNPSDEARIDRAAILQIIKSLRPNNPLWVD